MGTMTKKQVREEELERAIEDIRIARAAKKIDSIFFASKGVRIFYYNDNNHFTSVIIPFKKVVEHSLFFESTHMVKGE